MHHFENVIDLLECPYNPEHKLLSHTMARHVSRCRRAYGILKLHQCPFNPEHQVPEMEMTLHKLECEDRDAFEQYRFCFTTLLPQDRFPSTSPSGTGGTRRARDTTDLVENSPKSPVSTRRRTLAGTLPSSDANHTLPRVYDLRLSCRTSRKDASPTASSSQERKVPVAAISPLHTVAKIETLIRSTPVEKENTTKDTVPWKLRKFRTPVKISERKLSIDDFRQRWKQVHNERRAQSRRRDRSARRSCYH